MANINSARLLERFLRYVTIDTTANDATEDYPSSPGQLQLGKLLVEELVALGAEDVEQDQHGLIWATAPATIDQERPVVALNAHLDTSPEASGADVRPQLVRDYAGGDLPLPEPPAGAIRVDENPELKELIGCTLITTDGSTLLGGDDKAGLAVIMETVAHLLENPQTPHGPVRILFTCDEEIGRGADYVDLEKLAADVCYTLDGQGAGEIDTETFSADLATVRIRGVNIHPSIAKGRMTNAIKAAAEFLSRLPQDHLSPETTDARDGFIHPYQLSGGVAEVELKILLRDFHTPRLEQQAEMLRAIASDIELQYPDASVKVTVQSQYRNMAEGLETEPRAVRFAQEAHRRLNRSAHLSIIRGGTDGSQLTAKGLPTPNLSTGQHNPHSEREWVCLEEMVQATETLLELLQVWAGH